MLTPVPTQNQRQLGGYKGKKSIKVGNTENIYNAIESEGPRL